MDAHAALCTLYMEPARGGGGGVLVPGIQFVASPEVICSHFSRTDGKIGSVIALQKLIKLVHLVSILIVHMIWYWSPKIYLFMDHNHVHVLWEIMSDSLAAYIQCTSTCVLYNHC